MQSSKALRYLLTSSFMVGPFLSCDAAWSDPTQLSHVNSDQPAIAVDLTGNAQALWQGDDGSNYIIQSSSKSLLGGWSDPVNLSDSGQTAQSPSVGVDATGNAVAVWSRYDGWSSVIQSAQCPYLGSWTSPVNISDTGLNADSPKLSLHQNGIVSNAVAVWHRYNGYNFIMQAASLLNGGSWTSPTNISVSGQDALVPVVAVDTFGNAAGVCSRFDGSNFTSRAASYLSNQTWSPSFIISTPGSTASQQSIGMDGSGNSVIAWSYYDGTSNVIQVSYLHFGDGWSAPVTISTSGSDAYIPQVAAHSDGSAVVVWTGFDGSNYVAHAAMMDVNQNWSAPVILSTEGGDVNNISVAASILGDVVAVWDKTDGEISVIETATLPKNGTWSQATQISAEGHFAYLPVVAVDSLSRPTALWLEYDGTNSFVFGSSSL